MSNDNDGGPAFPSHGSMGEVAHAGMTLRDWFASTARHADLVLPNTILESAAILGIYECEYEKAIHWPQVLAAARYRYADAMLAARARK